MQLEDSAVHVACKPIKKLALTRHANKVNISSWNIILIKRDVKVGQEGFC